MRERYIPYPCCFNPRTYIRYDMNVFKARFSSFKFQSTYLYKVRRMSEFEIARVYGFQSTYLYKVRHKALEQILQGLQFQSTYLYKVRLSKVLLHSQITCFNPRTYIRYDAVKTYYYTYEAVSIHVPI